MRCLAFIVLLQSATNIAISSSSNGYETRIINGVVVFIEDYPYMVSIQLWGGHMCGGAILNEDTILTAAHCMKLAKYFPMRHFLNIEAGATKVFAGGQTIAVNYIYEHPSYDSKTSDFDIAVLKLKHKLQFNDKVKPIGLAGERAPTGSNASVAGWGVLTRSGHLSSRLNALQVPVLAQQTCINSYPNEVITERMFCAGYLEGGRDTCQGDSGGPLVFNNSVIGIVSWGYGCAQEGHPGVFTDVTKFLAYVQKLQ